jgi:hypothetical protein
MEASIMTGSWGSWMQAIRFGVAFNAFDKEVERKRKNRKMTMNLNSLERFRQDSFFSTELSARELLKAG